MISLSTINLIFDFILVLSAVWMIAIIRPVGGLWGKAFAFIAWGVMLLGLTHLLETVMFDVLSIDSEMVEFLHRLVFFTGFAMVAVGFKKIAQTMKP